MSFNPEEYNSKVCEEALEYALKTWGLKKVSLIEKGPYGVVYLTTDENNAKHAVKVCVKPTGESRSHVAAYLNREVEISMRINHPNVVKVYHGESFPTFTILDMEFCDTTLMKYITTTRDGKRTFRPLSEAEVRNIAKQLTSAIRALHEMGIMHRDIKLENILMVMNPDGSYTLKIADLVFAKNEAEARTCLGTPLYMAPEVLAVRDGVYYDNRCDFWSLGILYYLLLTGKYPFPVSSMADMYNSICKQDFVAISLPGDLDVSECCRHFVRHHLFKNPVDRMSDEEVKNHPFVMPTVHLISMHKPVNTDDFLNPLVCDVELGDIFFRDAKNKLGDRINEPHALRDYKAEPITWGDVARVVGITDEESLNDMVILTNGGVCCKKDTPVEMNISDDIYAMIVSSKNGISIGEMKSVEGDNLSESDVQLMTSTEHQGNIESMNSCLSVLTNFIKCCRKNMQLYQMMVQNCLFIEKHFCQNALKTEFSAKEQHELQDEVCKKFDKFPKVDFCPPVADKPLDIPDGKGGVEKLNAIRGEIKIISQSAQNKISSGDDNLTDELKQITDLWDHHKSFVDETKSHLTIACEAVRTVMTSLQKDVEVMLRLSHYNAILRNALTSSDVTATCRDLLQLVRCEYFRVSEESMSLLENPTEITVVATPPPVAAAAAAAEDSKEKDGDDDKK